VECDGVWDCVCQKLEAGVELWRDFPAELAVATGRAVRPSLQNKRHDKQPERIARLASGPSRAVILEGCGHVPHREDPKRVLSEVTQFLGRSPGFAM
jgi:pimeloyl-ACP methyl ester carboxylesterase